jgi:hypothetical protein
VTATKRRSRPPRLADELEAAGWTVERAKVDAERMIRAQHPIGEVISVIFERNDRGQDVFLAAERNYDDGQREELFSVAEVRQRLIPVVPFRLDAPAEQILAAVAGRTITWRNELTGRLECGEAPRGGPHLKLIGGSTDPDNDGSHRVLSFPSATGGFRAVRIDRITKIS